MIDRLNELRSQVRKQAGTSMTWPQVDQAARSLLAAEQATAAEIRVPSTWTVLAAEIRRLNALLALCERRGTREPAPSNFRAQRDQTSAQLADLILEGRAR